MALKIIRAQMKQRRDTAANWAANNPVLLEGELGFVLDHPNSYKVGDGSTPWNSLPHRGFDGNIVQELGDSSTSVISQAGISGLIAEQNTKLAQLSQRVDNIAAGGGGGDSVPVAEDGFFFTDAQGYVGVKIDATGLHAINLVEIE